MAALRPWQTQDEDEDDGEVPQPPSPFIYDETTGPLPPPPLTPHSTPPDRSAHRPPSPRSEYWEPEEARGEGGLLSEEQKQRFLSDGFVAVHGIWPIAMMDAAASAPSAPFTRAPSEG